MRLKVKEQPQHETPIPAGSLPRRMRVLFVTSPHRTGDWLAEALANDSAVTVDLVDVIGSAAGLERLRDEVYDAVLVTHEPGDLDALDFIEGLRAGGAEEPIVVIGAQSEQELAPLCYEVGADAYLCVHTTTTRMLIWKLARALERHTLLRENRRLAQAEKQRLEHEHHEAERLLDEQRALIRDLENLQPAQAIHSSEDDDEPQRPSQRPSQALPPSLIEHYRELLRAYVMMGSGNLGCEMGALADLLAGAGISTAETMQLHLGVAGDMVRGLGTRSARHVMTRADLLILEVMVHLGEGYRQRYRDCLHPPRQTLLPGFDETAPTLFDHE